jgi:hypothetical protein
MLKLKEAEPLIRGAASNCVRRHGDASLTALRSGRAADRVPVLRSAFCVLRSAFCFLHPVRQDVESEFDLVADAHQSMEGGRCIDVEIAAVDREFANRAQVVS